MKFYIQVRVFSFTRDIVQKDRIKNRKIKATKSLRKEIKTQVTCNVSTVSLWLFFEEFMSIHCKNYYFYYFYDIFFFKCIKRNRILICVCNCCFQIRYRLILVKDFLKFTSIGKLIKAHMVPITMNSKPSQRYKQKYWLFQKVLVNNVFFTVWCLQLFFIVFATTAKDAIS